MPTALGRFDLGEYLLSRPAVYDPWIDLCGRDGVDIAWRSPGPHGTYKDPWGLTSFRELRISLRAGLTGSELRCTLAHELLHLERGPFARSEGAEAREEAKVQLLTAQRLVDPTLVDCLLAADKSPTWQQVDAMLDVDEPTFRLYMEWRAEVSNATAAAAWEEHGLAPSRRGYPMWPPKWVGEYAPTPWTEPLIALLAADR